MATLFQALGAIVYQGYTTTERDALNAQDRMILWNTTTDQWEMYLSGDWRAVAILDANGHLTEAQHGTQLGDLHPEYARTAAPEVITTNWMLRSGGSIRARAGDPPTGEIVIQVKTSAGAPTHSASLGTLCWVDPDTTLYVNNTGSTSWTKQAKNSDLHTEAHAPESHTGQGATAAELETLTDTSDADSLHGHSNHGVSHVTDDHAEDHKARHAGGADALYSVHQYVFTPDAAPGDDVATGAHQGNIYVSGPTIETVKRITVICETAAGTDFTFTLDYDSGNDDFDSFTVDTEIDEVAVGTAQGVVVSSGFTTATIAARSLISLDVTAITGAPKDVTIILEVWRLLQR